MVRPFTGFVMLEAVLVGGWAALSALRGRPLGHGHVLGLLVLQAVLILHGAASLITLAAGHDAIEPGTHALYAAASLVILPLLIGVPLDLGRRPATPGEAPAFTGGISVGPPAERPPGEGPPGAADPWRAAVAAVACLAVVVVTSRMWVTWQDAG